MKKLFFASLIFSNFLFASVPNSWLVSPASGGTGYTQSFTFATNDSAGPVDLAYTWISFSSDGTITNSCTPLFYPQTSTLFLLNDAGTAWTGPVTMGSGSVLSNSKCSIPANSVSRTNIGNSWNFTVTPTFTPAFSGVKSILAFSSSAYNEFSGVAQIGTWAIPGSSCAPGVVTITPMTGAGTSQYFNIAAVDSCAGVSNIHYVWLRIGDVVNGCNVLWDYSTGSISILSNDGSNWNTSGQTGGSGAIGNNQCQVALSTASRGIVGNQATGSAIVSFLAGFTGVKPIYGTTFGYNGQGWNWFTAGTWNITGAAMDMSLTATEINTHEMLLDDATGQYIERPTSISPWIVRLKNGKNVHIAAADNVKVSKLTHSWEPVGDSFIYHFKIDTSDAPYIMRLGITEDQYVPIGESSEQTQPKGWHGLVQAWANLGEAELSDSSEFSLKSKWKPGLQAFFIMSDKAKEPIPSFPETENNVRIATAASIFNNSVRKFVIGPAIDPDLTPEGLHELVQRWVEDYGFGFLGPYLSGQPLSEIRANDAFEQEILDCLVSYGQIRS